MTKQCNVYDQLAYEYITCAGGVHGVRKNEEMNVHNV